MPRLTRGDRLLGDSPNHLILRGNNRRRLFSYPRDYRRFLWLVEQASETDECAVHALCLMANHVHNLSTPPTVDAASAFVARFAQRYAQVRNRQRDGSGKLFEERYFSKPILSGDQLAITTLYIEANPVRAGLVTDPIEYPWSTYALHAGEPERSAIPRSLWRPNAWYLSLGKTDRDRGLRYRELYRVYVETGQRPEHWFQADRIERAASEPYTRRLLRPDGSRAAEPNGFVRFGPEPEED